MPDNDIRVVDCFLSHNSADKPKVRKLANRLRAKGISVWLDEDELRPGVPWQTELELAIRTARSVAVLVGADGLGPWEDEEMQAALRLAVKQRRPVIPVLLPDAPRKPNLPLFLENRTWVDLRRGEAADNADAIDRLVWGITGEKPQARSIADTGAPSRFREDNKTETSHPPRPSDKDAASASEDVVDVHSPVAFRDVFSDNSRCGPEMIWLPGATFRMGSTEDDGHDSERQAHDVTLSHYAVSKYPITVGEFRYFVEMTGHRTDAEKSGGTWVRDKDGCEHKRDSNWRNPYIVQDNSHPVVCITWDDAKAYCDWLSKQTEQTYGLLSEAQWEHACRAGSETAYCFGDDERQLDQYASYSHNAGDRTRPVGESRANDWGLYDMHGNVWEWCEDWFADYSSGPEKDPRGPKSGIARVVRGGSWLSGASGCRSEYRHRNEPSYCSYDLGFRLSRTGPLHSYPFRRGYPKT